MNRATSYRLRLFGPPDPFDPTAWFGCSCKPVWLAVVAMGVRDYLRVTRGHR